MNLETQVEYKMYSQREDPNLLFLYEIKLHTRMLEAIKLRNGFGSCLGMHSEGREGDLALMWKESTCVTILSFLKYHIHASINSPEDTQWFFYRPLWPPRGS